MELCKVRFDGCHYLVQPYTNASPLSALEIATSSIEELNKKGLIVKKRKTYFIISGQGSSFLLSIRAESQYLIIIESSITSLKALI